MNYKVHREVKDGRLVRPYLGIPEVDAYLDFLKHRCRVNTWINYAHDLQVFVNAVGKPLALVSPSHVLSSGETMLAVRSLHPSPLHPAEHITFPHQPQHFLVIHLPSLPL